MEALDRLGGLASQASLGQLETPCVVIDTGRMERNIKRMAHYAASRQVKLRPHTKTHKLPQIAKLQLQAGAAGITVAKVSEAEVMEAHGLSDIFTT